MSTTAPLTTEQLETKVRNLETQIKGLVTKINNVTTEVNSKTNVVDANRNLVELRNLISDNGTLIAHLEEKLAIENNIPVFSFNSIKDMCNYIDNCDFDLT